LKIATWNSNGFMHHIDEVKAFLFTKINIMLISETHFYWNSKLANPKGRAPCKTITKKYLETIPQSMSHYLDLSFDHSPLIIEVNNKIETKMQCNYAMPCTLHNKQTNWYLFHKQVNTLLNITEGAK
ncbi:hypothetical protein ALC53_01424, partial [Atta colombica]